MTTPPADTPPAAQTDSTPDSAPNTAGATASKRRRLNRGAPILIGALLAILGFALVVQLQSNSKTDSLSTAREDDLVRILDDQNSRVERLQSQINDLQAAKAKLSDTSSNNAAARAEAQRQADALAILTGTVPAHGPGISVEVTDPQHSLKAEDLLDIVEELRGAGAEVIQFGSVRIGTESAFVDTSNNGISLDGTALQAPYEVLAIGEPSTMNTALNIPTGVVSTVRSVGGDVSIDQRDSISITAVRSISAPKYASPTSK